MMLNKAKRHNCETEAKWWEKSQVIIRHDFKIFNSTLWWIDSLPTKTRSSVLPRLSVRWWSCNLADMSKTLFEILSKTKGLLGGNNRFTRSSWKRMRALMSPARLCIRQRVWAPVLILGEAQRRAGESRPSKKPWISAQIEMWKMTSWWEFRQNENCDHVIDESLTIA